MYHDDCVHMYSDGAVSCTDASFWYIVYHDDCVHMYSDGAVSCTDASFWHIVERQATRWRNHMVTPLLQLQQMLQLLSKVGIAVGGVRVSVCSL